MAGSEEFTILVILSRTRRHLLSSLKLSEVQAILVTLRLMTSHSHLALLLVRFALRGCEAVTFGDFKNVSFPLWHCSLLFMCFVCISNHNSIVLF